MVFPTLLKTFTTFINGIVENIFFKLLFFGRSKLACLGCVPVCAGLYYVRGCVFKCYDCVLLVVVVCKKCYQSTGDGEVFLETAPLYTGKGNLDNRISIRYFSSLPKGVFFSFYFRYNLNRKRGNMEKKNFRIASQYFFSFWWFLFFASF